MVHIGVRFRLDGVCGFIYCRWVLYWPHEKVRHLKGCGGNGLVFEG